MEIRTARLLLRRPRPDDLAAMYAIMSDPRAMRYWSTLPHENVEVTRAWLDREIANLDLNGDDFVIALDGRVVGKVGAWNLPEFGFILHPDIWGQGIAFEAATAYLDHGFSTSTVDAITADVDPDNIASLGLLAKLGFVETGRAENTFLIGDVWHHSVYLALPREAWQFRTEGHDG